MSRPDYPAPYDNRPPRNTGLDTWPMQLLLAALAGIVTVGLAITGVSILWQFSPSITVILIGFIVAMIARKVRP